MNLIAKTDSLTVRTRVMRVKTRSQLPTNAVQSQCYRLKFSVSTRDHYHLDFVPEGVGWHG